MFYCAEVRHKNEDFLKRKRDVETQGMSEDLVVVRLVVDQVSL